jgi:hypothetical protein
MAQNDSVTWSSLLCPSSTPQNTLTEPEISVINICQKKHETGNLHSASSPVNPISLSLHAYLL